MTEPELERLARQGESRSVLQPPEPRLKAETHRRASDFCVSAACSSAVTRASMSSISMALAE
jgi:hypothetical protein